MTGLKTSIVYGIDAGVGEMRKITVEVSEDDLAAAQDYTGAGSARRLRKQKGLRAKIADTLIAQSCIDHDVALITRDGDFRHFAKHCGLKLA